MLYLRHGLAALAIMALLNFGAPATAQAGPDSTGVDQQDQRAAESATLLFVGRFDEGDLGLLYDEELAPAFKALMAREIFIQQGNFLRLQSGGKAIARELIGAQHFTQTPTGQTGSFFYVRYRTRHPNGLVFEDVYVQQIGSAWKVMGFNTLPAPQQ